MNVYGLSRAEIESGVSSTGSLPAIMSLAPWVFNNNGVDLDLVNGGTLNLKFTDTPNGVEVEGNITSKGDTVLASNTSATTTIGAADHTGMTTINGGCNISTGTDANSVNIGTDGNRTITVGNGSSINNITGNTSFDSQLTVAGYKQPFFQSDLAFYNSENLTPITMSLNTPVMIPIQSETPLWPVVGNLFTFDGTNVNIAAPPAGISKFIRITVKIQYEKSENNMGIEIYLWDGTNRIAATLENRPQGGRPNTRFNQDYIEWDSAKSFTLMAEVTEAAGSFTTGDLTIQKARIYLETVNLYGSP